MNQINDESLEPNARATLCEHEAARLLRPEDGLSPHRECVAEAHALAALGQSLRLRGCEEWLASIRIDGVGVG